MTGNDEQLLAPASPRGDVVHFRQFDNPPWKKENRDGVTVLLSVVEPRKSFFVSAFLERMGIRYVDLGGFDADMFNLGKRYATPSLCNPSYYVSGQIIRYLDETRARTGLSKAEMCDRHVFVCPSGPCSPCRYGMYTQEYRKALHDAGYVGFRIITFSSDVFDMESGEDDALQFTFGFRINLLMALVLADAVHARDVETRPYEKEPGSTRKVVEKAEKMLFEAFRSPAYLLRLPIALRAASRMFDAIPRVDRNLPRIFITGEIFANNSHGAPNYDLREFCMRQGCQVNPAFFTMRVYFDFIRRMDHTRRALKYEAAGPGERRRLAVFLARQRIGLSLTNLIVRNVFRLMAVRTPYPDVEALFELAHPYYHRRIYGGEGNLEVAEAIEQSAHCDGFISIKPFGCMCSSGVSDGVQSRIQEIYPDLNFLSVETSGDNATNVLNRVSMLIFKARRHHRSRQELQPRVVARDAWQAGRSLGFSRTWIAAA
jgi:predicted nucleotide-binding protein (sugar kinase/HSP70/actin superfamily)